ncbi:MAG: FAD-dependent monooxygenase [Alphaproteobacteria bacterium]|nr:FAD-dependent monooxygenase [Alphaproteobacteria bacterium]
MTARYDLIVIGGGIGGSALAATMAKAGRSVLLLERTTTFEDKVRGEWIAPWGVAETKRLGLYDLLLKAGGHHLDRHVSYDESRAPEEAEAAAMPLSMFVEGVPGPLCIGHPHHCQTLFDEAARCGAEALRGVDVTSMRFGADPEVAFEHEGKSRVATARLIIGADGRTSTVREPAGIVLDQDRPHHLFAGMLVEDVKGWDEKLQAIGTEGDFAFLVFPQGNGRIRVYGSFELEARRRFAGPDGPQHFLDAFRINSAPANRHIADGRPAGPVLTFFNNSTWADRPFAEGVVLVGDAAGCTDPIIGMGLSLTYRDVRLVTDILKASDDWSPAAFEPYATERAERMRRLRFAASLVATIDAEFGPAPRERRRALEERRSKDPSLGIHAFAIMAGPESIGPEFFTPEHRARVLGEAA